MAYRILSFDGGGIKGVYSLKLLERVIAECPDFLDSVDLVAGTSTGGIIAALIASNHTPTEILELYKDKLPSIFKDSFWDNTKDLGNLIGAEYDYKNLRRVALNKFGDSKLGSLPKKVVISSFDLDNEKEECRTWKPKIFNNFQDVDELIADVVVRTSAAPTYFPVFQGYIDGAVAANNPALLGLAQALDKKTGGQKLEDIRLLSIGTTFSPKYIKGNRLDWGVSQWARYLIDILLEGSVAITHYQCTRLLRDNYHRVDKVLEEMVKLDEVSKVDEMINHAEQQDLTETFEWVDKTWKT